MLFWEQICADLVYTGTEATEMATVPREPYETAVGTVSEWWTGLLDRLASITPWLVVAAVLLVYGMLYAVLLGGAAVGAVYLGAIVPGAAGFVVSFTVGLGLVAAAPTVARQLFVRAVDAMETRREA